MSGIKDKLAVWKGLGSSWQRYPASKVPEGPGYISIGHPGSWHAFDSRPPARSWKVLGSLGTCRRAWEVLGKCLRISWKILRE